MDAETLGAALALAKKTVLPAAAAQDEGAALVVGSDGEWTKGQPISATITVSDTTLVVTSGE